MSNDKGAIPRVTRSTSLFQLSNQPQHTSTQRRRKPTINNNQRANTTLANMDVSVYQCEVCLVTDDASKVCCDECNLWSHFKCVHVTSDIANYEWFCPNCTRKKQEVLINVVSEVTGAAGQTSNTTAYKDDRINFENPSEVVNNPTVSVSQPIMDQTTNEPIHRNSTHIHKSKSLKTASSTSSRRKALALKRLEEEQQLQRMRDEEERQRRDEERRQREIKDKEYLDKKYSILDLDTDSSMSLDGYDDNLNPNRMENVRKWTEELVSRIGSVIPSAEVWAPDYTSDRTSKITPQMSSTNFLHPRESQLFNPIDDPTQPLVVISGSSEIQNIPLIVTTKLSSDQSTSPSNQIMNPFNIDGQSTQSTQSNSIDLTRGRQIVPSQLESQSNILKSQSFQQTSQPSRIEFTNKNQEWHSMFGSYQSNLRQAHNDMTTPFNKPFNTLTVVTNSQQANNSTQANNQAYSQPVMEYNQQTFHQIGSSSNPQMSTNSTMVNSTSNAKHQQLSTNNQLKMPLSITNTHTTASNFQSFVQPTGLNNLVIPSAANNSTSMVESHTTSLTMTQGNTTYTMANQQSAIPRQMFMPNSQRAHNSYLNTQPSVLNQTTIPNYVIPTTNDQTFTSTQTWSHMSQASMNPNQTLYQQSRMGNQQPITLNQQPFMLNQQQFTSNRPFNLNQQPPISNQPPLISNYQPISSVLQSSQANQPLSTSQQYMTSNVSHQSFIIGQPTVQNFSPITTGPIYSTHQSNTTRPTNPYNGLNNGLNAGNMSYGNANGTLGNIGHLTAEQIASRHVIPKDLPKFFGDPEDWQTFFSAYDTSTTMCGYNNHENLGRLQKCIKGDAYEAVRYLLVHADSVPAVIHTLSMMYGRPELIIEKLIKEIQNEPAPKDDNLASIMKFAIKVRNLSGTIRNTGALEHLNNPMLINTITDKLPTQIQLNWAYHKSSVGVADLAILGDWLSQIAEAACLVVRQVPKMSSRKKDQRDQKDQKTDSKDNSRSTSSKSNNYINTQVESSVKKNHSETTEKVKSCPACENGSCTSLAKCKKFKEASRVERWSIIKNNKLCTRCLGNHHFYRCRSTQVCKSGDCNLKHHTLLHNHEKSPEPQSTKNGKSPKSNEKEKDTNNSSGKFSSNAGHDKTISKTSERVDIFRIVPIMVFHKSKGIQIFAYLDDGSNMTTMEESLAKELDIHGTSAPICVDWAFGQTHSSVESKIISTRISGCFNKAQQYDLDNVRTVKELCLPTQTISQSWIEQYSHLKRLPISTYESAKPRMLIGLQYSRLMVSLHTIEGSANEPIACKTRLGWVIQGPSYANDSQPHRKYSMNICECQNNDIKLHQLVKEYFSTENLGVKVTDTLIESKEIQRSKQILESTTIKKDGRYETGLLWKYDQVKLPDSYNMALKRLRCVETKMARNPQLAENLCNQITQFVDKKYIRKLSANELRKNVLPVWYLPTFPAFNPKKPEKVRIVWDGAAKVQNISLNSMLLTGPDQLTPLPDILRRFRERSIAITGDIKEMFHQIRIRPEDQHVQRFLWRDGNSAKNPDVYVMEVMTFGLTCSPSQAQFVKNKNALEFKDEYPEAVNAIVNNHYVDDMLESSHSVDVAAKLVENVKLVHKKAGFEIRNFTSNSKELLERIGENPDQQSKNMNVSIELGTERVLGMFWNTATDSFTYSLKFTPVNEQILSGKQCPTKREVLRILMSVFDPLGLLANYLIYTKILLQEIWRSNISWDENLTPQIYKKWVAWIKTLPSVENIQIPRLCSPKLSPNLPKSIQLHIFVDASAEAYATAIYFRIEDDEGVDCCLVGAKTKVAPNKPMSIPRLELQGGVLGTRLATSIRSSQTLKFDKQVFWTDSQTVMGWINSEARRYNQFVAFRIGEILEASDQAEWRWIPSEHNVADEATKSKQIAKLDSLSRWFKAPKFLYEKENTWFKDEGDIEFFTEEEVRPSFTMAVRDISQPQMINLERFSQWNRLVRAQAYTFRFIYNVRRNQHERQFAPLSQQEIQDAENHLYRRAQMDCFLDEVMIMKHNQKAPLDKYKDFEKSSILRTFSPYLDENGVIRMKGRTDAASAISFETKRPIILPRRHRITKLIVDYFHRQYKHKNHSTALNEIHQKYAIPALRVVMKGIRTSCQKCKNASAEPKIPEMAELPPARLAAYTLPFTFVGLDYFGPLRVRNGRKTRSRPTINEKRWILLFTCLTTRAIWMEIAHSLDTNSCIMSIENFIARKGQPREVYSDNGSSFHSTDKELNHEFSKMNQREVEERFSNSEMVWKFNPPATPHMGGVWERLIRTVKSCLKETMKTRTPNDEMLKNLIVEAENIVNSRPLTYVSLESADDEALTPNHILLGSSNGRKPLSTFTDKDLARNTYKAVQVLANNFWHRFVLEYMPTLTKRTKWFKHVEPIKVGDVVIVVDERNERNTWPKGIVEEVLPGKNGIVRQVMVRTVKGIRRRSVGKLAVLEVKTHSSDMEVKPIPVGSVNEGENVGNARNYGNTDLRDLDSATSCQMYKLN